MHLNLLILVSYLVSHTLTAESRAVYSSGIPGSAASWVKGSRASMDQVIYLDFTLAASEVKLKSAAQTLQNISEPTSENFGQHWTAEQVTRYFEPSKDSVREVLTWLSASAVPRSSLRASRNGGHIFINTTVEQAEKLLGTQYYQYSNGQAAIVGTEAYSLPLSISKYVDYVLPALMSSRPSTERQAHRTVVPMKSQRKRSNISTIIEVDCFKYVTPECLRLLYNIPEAGNGSSHPNNSFGIYEPAWASYLTTDLDAFFTDFQPTLVGARPNLLSIDGGFLQDKVRGDPFNLEPDLDFQYSMSLAYPLLVTDIQVRECSYSLNSSTERNCTNKHGGR
jgi:tripeptidyl-peptidase-1